MLPFQQMQFPRRKNFIRDLNILLDSNPVTRPEKSLSLHFGSAHGTRNSVKRKNFHEVINCARNNTAESLRRKNKVAAEHFRTVGSVKNFEAEKRMAQSGQASKRQKMKSMLSLQNIRKQLMQSRKISTAQTHRWAKQQRQQVRNPSYDLRMVSSAQLPRSQQDSNLGEFKSLEVKREGELYDYRPRETPTQRKEYLRKGSSINKCILNNIVRLKLTRVQEKGKGEEEYIGNQEILKMIKLYKGTQTVGKEIGDRAKYSSTPAGKQRGKRSSPMMYLQGWENETEEYDPMVNLQQNPEPNMNE